jgi:hypothetical protein
MEEAQDRPPAMILIDKYFSVYRNRRRALISGKMELAVFDFHGTFHDDDRAPAAARRDPAISQVVACELSASRALPRLTQA